MAQGITVVIPIWHGRKFIERALEGVSLQRSPLPIQIVAIEDGTPSDQRSEDLVAQFPHVEYYLLEKNQGVAHARVMGAEKSRFASGYLAFLDQDDVWHPQFLTTLTEALSANPRAGFAVANAQYQFPDGTQYTLYQTKHPSIRLSELKMTNPIVSPSQALMTLEAFHALGWTGELPGSGADDWLLWLTFLVHGYQGIYYPEPLVTYLDHPNAGHQNTTHMQQSVAGVVNTWFPQLGLSPWNQRQFWGYADLTATLSHVRSRKLGPVLTTGFRALARDPAAYFSAMWHHWQKKRHGWA